MARVRSAATSSLLRFKEAKRNWPNSFVWTRTGHQFCIKGSPIATRKRPPPWDFNLIFFFSFLFSFFLFLVSCLKRVQRLFLKNGLTNWNQMNVMIGDRWGQVSRNQMLIHSPKLNGSPDGNRWAPRSGSLYEETPLFGN